VLVTEERKVRPAKTCRKLSASGYRRISSAEVQEQIEVRLLLEKLAAVKASERM